MKNLRYTNWSLATVITMGIGTGAALGVALGDVGAGVGFGAAAGILFGLAATRRTAGTGGRDSSASRTPPRRVDSA